MFKTEIIIPKNIFLQMINHSQIEYPNECCGILAGKDSQVSQYYKMTNIEKSSINYFMDTQEQFKVMKELQDQELQMLAIYHSHPLSLPYPSLKDIDLAFYEDTVYIIIGLENKIPIVKGFLIRDKKVVEVNLVVE